MTPLLISRQQCVLLADQCTLGDDVVFATKLEDDGLQSIQAIDVSETARIRGQDDEGLMEYPYSQLAVCHGGKHLVDGQHGLILEDVLNITIVGSHESLHDGNTALDQVFELIIEEQHQGLLIA